MTTGGSPAPMPHVDGLEHRWVRCRDIDVHVAEGGRGTDGSSATGDAPVTVLLHGWPQHWWCWRRVVGGLVDRSHVVAVDLRGHGWTDAPRAGYRKEELADDLFALLDELGHDRVTLVGHDWGGWIGFLAALRHPDRFQSLVALGIVHPFQRLDAATLAQAWRGAYQLALAAPVVAQAVLRASPVPVATAIAAGTGIRGAIDDATRRHYGAVLQQPARARASVQLYRTFVLHELAHLGRYGEATLTVPTTLLVGARDPIATRAFLDGWEDHAQDMTVDVLDHVGHFVPEEAPARTVEAIEQAWNR